MRELLKHVTTNELRLLMNTLMESETTTSDQADMLFAVVDELTERGELPKKTEYETQAALEKMMTMIQAQEDAQQVEDATEPEWMDDLRADMLQDRRRRQTRRKAYLRSSLIAASAVFILFLTNAIALAAGYDFLGSISRWSKDAVSFVFGIDSHDKPTHGVTKEYDALIMTLDNLGIQVDLPTFIPDGFMFASIEPDEPDEYSNIVAWFANGDDEFSINVKQVVGVSKERFNESDGEETSEIYSNANGAFMITSNKRRVVAIWHQGIYEIIIQGNITYELLTQILDSI